jgi:hypothetical protein
MVEVEQQLRLSGNGMRNIATSRNDNDFVFIVGDDRYECPWFVADFLSPKVSRLHSSDASINEFKIETSDPTHQFGEFVSLGRGSPVCVTKSNRSLFISLACELCNSELYFLIVDPTIENLTVSSFCTEFVHPIFYDDFPERAIDFLASHFNEFDSSFLNNLSVSTLCRILSYQSLQLDHEDSLYTFIRSHLESHPTYIALLEFVRFEFLTCEAIHNFISWSFEHFDEMISSFSL